MLARLALVALAVLAAAPAWAGALDRVRQSGTITLGYRADAQPFSYKTALGEPAGFSVDLCRVVALEVKQTLGLAEIALRYVEVNAEDRFEAVRRGAVDIECGASTVTLARREQVDFSLLTFASGATLLYRADGPASFEELAGRTVGVRAGTTTERMLADIVARGGIAATLRPVASHEEGVERLARGELAAYFGDGGILLFHWLGHAARDTMKLSDRVFSYEPYALVVARGDDDFRLVVDRALARLYRTGEIADVFEATFGKMQPAARVQALWQLQSLPE